MATDRGPLALQAAWTALKARKVVQWTLAFAAFGFALLQAVDIMVGAFGLPPLVTRLVLVALPFGLVATAVFAWYHGDRGQQRFSGGELTIVASLLFVGGAVLWVVGRSSAPEHAATTTVAAQSAPGAPAPTAGEAPVTSVAVMPFANLTGDPAKEYLGDGLAEELINSLTTLPGLRVPARTSTFAYKGRNADMRVIGRELDVRAILEGSVRSAGDRLRVTAQLIDARTGYHFWSHNYDRASGDLFALQDEIAATITEAIGATMKVALRAPSSASHGTDPEAYELYLQGRTLCDRSNPQDLARCFTLYEAAIAKDPKFGRPVAQESYQMGSGLAFGGSTETAAQAEEHAHRALALDPKLAPAHTSLTLVAEYRGDWLAAAASMQSAVAADPDDPQTLLSQAINLEGSVGHIRVAQKLMQRAYQLAPAYTPAAVSLGVVETAAGRDAEATRMFDRAVELGYDEAFPPIPDYRSIVARRAARWSDAIGVYRPMAATQRAGTGYFDNMNVRLSAAYVQLVETVIGGIAEPTKRAAAVKALQDFERHNLLAPPEIAWYVALHDLDGAFRALNAVITQNEKNGVLGPPIWLALWMPEFQAFRRDPHFAAVAARLKMVPYWQKYGPPDGCTLAGEQLRCT